MSQCWVEDEQLSMESLTYAPTHNVVAPHNENVVDDDERNSNENDKNGESLLMDDMKSYRTEEIPEEGECDVEKNKNNIRSEVILSTSSSSPPLMLSNWDMKRLSNFNYIVPFFLATRYFVDRNVITFVNAAVCDDTASLELRGKMYRTHATKRSSLIRQQRRRVNDAVFVSHKDIDKSFLFQNLTEPGGIPRKIVNLIEKEMYTNKRYERDHRLVDPAYVISFIFRRCIERTYSNCLPLIVTWQSFQDMKFLQDHTYHDGRSHRCYFLEDSCLSSSCKKRQLVNDALCSAKYYTLDDRGRVRFVCASRSHGTPICGLTNPLWINMSTRRFSDEKDEDRFVLEFKFEDRIVIYKVVLGRNDSRKFRLNIEEAHSMTECNQIHENTSCLSGVLSYAKCIFSQYARNMFTFGRYQ